MLRCSCLSSRFSSVGSIFRSQVQALMTALKACQPHYIRCIKVSKKERKEKREQQQERSPARPSLVLTCARSVSVCLLSVAHLSRITRRCANTHASGFGRRGAATSDSHSFFSVVLLLLQKPNEFDKENVARQVKYLGLLENVRVRRAGYAHRSTFERFLKRYAMLSKTIWSGKGRGQPKDFCATVCADLGWTPNKEFCMGKSKLFIQEATTLFALEDALERRQDDAIVTIQRAYKNYRNKRASAVLRSNAYELVNGRKERRRGSVSTRYQGDYISAARNKLIQGLLVMNGPKEKLLVSIARLPQSSRLNAREVLCVQRSPFPVALCFSTCSVRRSLQASDPARQAICARRGVWKGQSSGADGRKHLASHFVFLSRSLTCVSVCFLCCSLIIW